MKIKENKLSTQRHTTFYLSCGPEDGSKDVFVHISALQKCGIDTLNENDAVEFTLEEYKGREGVGEIKLV